jgi:hypothetical protein
MVCPYCDFCIECGTENTKRGIYDMMTVCDMCDNFVCEPCVKKILLDYHDTKLSNNDYLTTSVAYCRRCRKQGNILIDEFTNESCGLL